MHVGGRVDRSVRPRLRAVAAAAQRPRRFPGERRSLERFLPGGRSLLLAALLAAAALAAYLVAGMTSLFAVERLEVRGAPPDVAHSVRKALSVARGESLVGIDLDRLTGLAEAVPTVAGVSFDRAFPHTLEVDVVPERPIAVVRRGAEAYLVSARGRVVAEVGRRSRRMLPRLWAGRGADLAVGGLAPAELMPALRAVTPLGRLRFPARVASVRTVGDDLRLRLRSGLELRLGGGDDLLLKLAVAATVLPRVMPDTGYLDVSVPGRPVAGTEPPAVESAAPPVETAAVTEEERTRAESGTETQSQPQVEVESETSSGPSALG